MIFLDGSGVQWRKRNAWVVQPAIWVEGVTVREEVRVMVGDGIGHAEGSARWDDVLVVNNGFVPRDTGQALGGAVGKT